MTSVLVVYYSRTGNTRTMAEYITRGARNADAHVTCLPVEEVPVESLAKYDAIIVGTPDYYGGMAAEIKALFDASISLHGKLDGRVGGAFATAANIGGGNETAILGVIHALLVHGMIVPGVSVGDHYGPVSINAPDERARTQAISYGQRIARLAQKLAG